MILTVAWLVDWKKPGGVQIEQLMANANEGAEEEIFFLLLVEIGTFLCRLKW